MSVRTSNAPGAPAESRERARRGLLRDGIGRAGHWFRARRAVRGVGVLVSGTAAGQAIALLAAPVITRLYLPTDYGLLTVYASLLGILGAVSALSYHFPVPIARRDAVAANVLVLAAAMVVTFAGALTVAVALLGRPISDALAVPDLAPLLWLLPLGILGAGFYTVLTFWALRRKSYSRIARTRVSQSVGGAGTQIALGFLHFGAIGLVLGHIVGQAGGLFSLARSSWADRRLLRHVRLSRLRYVGWRYRRFPQLNGPSLVLNSSGAYAAPLLMAVLFGPQTAGLFALADRITSTPIRLVGRAVGQVYLSEAARLGDEPDRLSAMVWKTVRYLAAMAVIPALLLLLAGEPLFVWAFGEPWREAGVYARILSVWFFLKFITSPVSQNFNILERQDLALVFNASRLLLVVGSLLLPWYLGVSSVMAIGFYSAGMCVSYLLLLQLQVAAIRARRRALAT